MSNLRSYFSGPQGVRPEVIGSPKARQSDTPTDCPNCGCDLMEVRVLVGHKLLEGGEGHGIYMGCPACPYASPIVMTNAGAKK